MLNAPFGSAPFPPIDMRVSSPSFCTRVLDKRYAREGGWVSQSGRTDTLSRIGLSHIDIAPTPPMSRPLVPHAMLCTGTWGVLGGGRDTTAVITMRCRLQ